MNESQPILIPVPPFFSFQECIWFLDRNYDDCLHIIDKKGITKALEIDGDITLFSIVERPDFLEIKVLQGKHDSLISEYLIRFVVEWFDMDRDIQPFYHLLEKDPYLGYMCDFYHGLRLIGITDLFEALCWSIIGQQINLSFAYKLKRRLVEKYGKHVEFENEVFYTFPSCHTLALAEPEELRTMQFSQKKAEYVIGIAKAFARGDLSKKLISEMPDFESRQKLLMSYRGIGLWTANYALMKSLRESDGIPHGDVGLLNALTRHGIISSRGEKERIEQFFGTYNGWESYAVIYLWRSLTVK
jgi:DNA-3-methyladenine glycosylase II